MSRSPSSDEVRHLVDAERGALGDPVDVRHVHVHDASTVELRWLASDPPTVG